MKLISLNTWGGKVYNPLINFVNANKSNTDIFCFQEIYNTTTETKQYKNLLRANLLDELRKILPNFHIFYFPTLFNYDPKAKKVNFDLSYGPAICVKKYIDIIFYENYFISHEKNLYKVDEMFSNLATPLQQIDLHYKGKHYSIFNFHGTPYPGSKLDTPRRIVQSKKIIKFIKKCTHPKILVGDFNLLPNTKSVKIIESEMINLIDKFDIDRTRSKLNPYFGKRSFQSFADFTFVSEKINVKSFEVPKDNVSDHLPMFLEFS